MGLDDDGNDEIELHSLSDRELLVIAVTRLNGVHRWVTKIDGRVGVLEKWGYILTGVWIVVSTALTFGVAAAWELAKKKWGGP